MKTIELIERYLATWNEQDPRRRRTEIDTIWADDARYVDPLGVADGRDAIDTTIAGAQQQFPGLRFRLAGPVDAHHNLARFTWELAANGDQEALVIGFDVAVLAEDGRLQDVHGFLDKVPAH
jgi:hypothetical protein